VSDIGCDLRPCSWAAQAWVDTNVTLDTTVEVTGRRLLDDSSRPDPVESDELLRRIAEQAATVELSQLALEGSALDVLLDRAVILLARNLDVEFANVVQLLSGGDLLVRTCIDLSPDLVPTAHMAGGVAPEVSDALASAGPVVFDDIRCHPRSSGAGFLADHGVVSGMTVRIGASTAPFGLLGAYSTSARRFTPDEVQFLTAMANIVSISIRRARVESELRESEERFRAYLEAAPDATVIVDSAGRIVLVNEQTERVFGYRRDELVGLPVETLLPERLRGVHVRDRAGYVAAPRCRRMGAGLELLARHRDGSEFPVDVSLSPLPAEAGPGVCAAVRDVTERRQAEDARRRLRDFRRQQALEMNDNVVQGLAVASYALDAGDPDGARTSLRHTLDTARQMIGALLVEEPQAAVAPGDLVRARPAAVPCDAALESAAEMRTGDAVRVVLADDTRAVRTLLRIALETKMGFEVVGEATNGQEAIDICREQKPDVVLLDLAMPVVDGLEAIPRIRQASPDTRIVVLSGYGDPQMSNHATRLGADTYIEKGADLDIVAAQLRQLCGR